MITGTAVNPRLPKTSQVSIVIFASVTLPTDNW